MYVYIYIYKYIYTWTMALIWLETGRQVFLKECAEKQRVDLEQNLNLKEVRQQPSPMISYGDCQVCITRPFGCPLFTCASESSCDTSNAWPLGPAAFSREVRKNRTMTYGPIWSQKWWEMVPDTHLQKNHGPMSGEKWSQHLSECRYQSTDLSTRWIDHGRYRRSMRIHLPENTVDIDGR